MSNKMYLLMSLLWVSGVGMLLFLGVYFESVLLILLAVLVVAISYTQLFRG